MRAGTPASQAAKVPSRPAFGVLNSVISGLSRRRSHQSRASDTRSASGDIFRSIGIAMALDAFARSGAVEQFAGA